MISVVAMGQHLVILTRGIDLSVGSNLALATVVGALVWKATGSPELTVITMMASGAFVGAINGGVYVFGRLPHPFIITLATLSIAKGLALELVDGRAIPGMPDVIRFIGGSSILGVPVSSLVVLGVAALVLTQGVQGIAITPVDPTVAPALDSAIAAGIKVVLINNGIPDWKGLSAIATTNNYEAGKIAGQYLASVLKDGDTLGVLEGVPGVPALDDRVNGMLEGLSCVKVEIVGKGATNCTQELGVSVAEDLLTAHPDLKAIYAACGPPAVGGTQAIENAGIANDAIVMVGFDACCGELDKVVSGQEDATVAQFPAKMGELGVDTLVKAIRGESIEAVVDTGAGLVTSDNVKDFM